MFTKRNRRPKDGEAREILSIGIAFQRRYFGNQYGIFVRFTSHGQSLFFFLRTLCFNHCSDFSLFPPSRPPYLALQYVWSSGSYSAYGFVLFAGALVPMQGFWNCIAFKRNQIKRVINNVTKSLRSTTIRQTSSGANASGNSTRFSLMNTFKRSSQNPNRNFATADAASSKNTVSGTSTNILSEKSKTFNPSDTLQSGTIIDEAIPTNSPKVDLEENSASAS